MQRYTYIVLFFIMVFSMAKPVLSAIPNPKERIDFWQENYTALTKYDDPRVTQAYRIFERVVKAAGHRPGVEPRLQIIKEDPHNMALPIAIPDGWIILSKKVLDICYRNSEKGDSRLGFVLAHEIAHQLEDDFWHMKFFQALQANHTKDRKLVDEIQKIVKDSDRILAKELRADELGIIYAMMAGYDVNAIITKDEQDNFFNQWEFGINPKRLFTEIRYSSTHPTARQRTAAVRSRLQQVAEKGDLFNLGLWFYQAGDFHRAQLAFDEFRQYYPGREIYHNLASSWHQLAILHYKPTIKEQQQLPFQLALGIDPLNRASRLAYRSKPDADDLFRAYINRAIDNYQKAIALDPEYALSYTNLACAWLLLNQPYKAIAILQDGEKHSPLDPTLLTNMGVAFFYANNPAKAREYLQLALRYSPTHAPAIFNLGVISQRTTGSQAAKKYWQTYLKLDSRSAWAQRLLIHTNQVSKKIDKTVPVKKRERLDTVEIGTYLEELPASWQPLSQKNYQIDKTSHKLFNYKNGIQVLTEADEIRIIIADNDYPGSTARGIKVGQPIAAVIDAYGVADRIDWTPRGKSLAYIEAGISFQLQNDNVSGWILYWD